MVEKTENNWDSTERYRVITENVQDSISIIGSSFKLEYVNPSYVKLFGYPLNEIIDKPILEILHPADRAERHRLPESHRACDRAGRRTRYRVGGNRMIVPLPILALAEGAEPVTLTTAGATIMTLSVMLVLGLTVFCFWRILREPKPSEHHHAPLDIEMADDDTRRIRCPNPDCRALNEPHAEYCCRCGGPLEHHHRSPGDS